VRTVSVNASEKGKTGRRELYPHPSPGKHGRDRFDKDAGSAISLARISPLFSTKKLAMRQIRVPRMYTRRVPRIGTLADAGTINGCAAHHSRRFPTFHLKNRRKFRSYTNLVIGKFGNWAECSTESASIIELWAQGSIKQ
jgi:hypothetical protein